MNPSISPYLPIRRFTGGHKKPIQCLAFSETGNHLASACEDGTLVIWKTDSGIQVSSFQLESPALSLAWDCQRETRIFIGCLNGIVGYIDKYEVFFSYVAC
jgi:WD40 repeat protein